MINKGNLSEYNDDVMLDIFTPTVNGWSNGMQIPTQTPLAPQKIIFTEGSLNFKQVSVPAGFVYHKISIQKNNAFVYNDIVHTSIKLTNNDSFIYADTLTEYDGGLELPGRNISKVGITYVMYPHIVLRLEFLNTYNTINDNIKFNVENPNNAVLVEIFIELNIRNTLNGSLFYNTEQCQDLYQIYEFIRSCIIKNADKKKPILLFKVSLKDIFAM